MVAVQESIVSIFRSRFRSAPELCLQILCWWLAVWTGIKTQCLGLVFAEFWAHGSGPAVVDQVSHHVSLQLLPCGRHDNAASSGLGGNWHSPRVIPRSWTGVEEHRIPMNWHRLTQQQLTNSFPTFRLLEHVKCVVLQTSVHLTPRISEKKKKSHHFKVRFLRRNTLIGCIFYFRNGTKKNLNLFLSK